MVIITDIQYFEGFTGALGGIVAYIFLHNILRVKNIGVVIGLSFIISWLFRKIMMNYYTELKIKKQKNKLDYFIILTIILISILVYSMPFKRITYKSIIVYLIIILNFYFFVKPNIY